MKKFVRFTFTTMIAIGLLLVSFSTVFATTGSGAQNVVWGDPIPSSSDKGIPFTSNVLGVWQLPGTVTLGSGMIVPAGFPNNEEQFGGNGIKISGVPEGKSIQICFDFPTYNRHWEGTISEWNGTKWVPVATSISTPAERNATACTTVAGNGFFALIIGYHGPVESILVPFLPD